MKRPNFFIVGAPKCGTTSLAHWLGQHPQVFMSPVKEPHFFNTDMQFRHVRTRAEYFELFKEAGPQHSAIGEASTWYLFSREAVPNIIHDIGDAKLIVCLRNPYEMVVSLHNQNLVDLNEHLQDFEEAWLAQADRKNGQQVTRYCADPTVLLYREACSLGTQVERLLRTVPRENVLFQVLDDIREDPRREFSSVLSFLGVPDRGDYDLSPQNSSYASRSVVLSKAIKNAHFVRQKLGIAGFRTGILAGIKNWNRRPEKRRRVSPTFFREHVVPALSPEIEKLEDLLQRDLSAWKRLGA